MTFRFTTAGESHGRGLVGILEGIPAGLPLSAADVDGELKRRQGGYGRGARMKIESDRIEWLAGVRAGETLGSPIAMLIWNRDWEHWQDVMAPEADSTPDPQGRRRQVTRPRPGHADLAGSLKYDRNDKLSLYAEAGVEEYWIVLPVGLRRRLQEAAQRIRYRDRFTRSRIGRSHRKEPLPSPFSFE